MLRGHIGYLALLPIAPEDGRPRYNGTLRHAALSVRSRPDRRVAGILASRVTARTRASPSSRAGYPVASR